MGLVQLSQAPFTPPGANQVTSEAQITIDPKGEAKATFRERFSGTIAASMRGLFQNEPQQKKILSRLLASNYPGALLIGFAISGDQKDSKSVGLELVVSIPNFARREEGALSIPVHADPTTVLQRNAPLDSRKHPLELRHLSMESTDAVIQFPLGWEVASVPASVFESNPYADYALSVTEEGQKLILHESLTFKQAAVPPADYPEFRRFLKAVSRHRGTRLVVKPTTTQ
jgi:hypothetical protein